MSDLLVVPVPGVWGNWEALVKASGVHFNRPMFELGEELFSKNPWPEEKRLVLHASYGGFSSTTVTYLIQHHWDEDLEPAHPAYLLSAAAHMRWREDWLERAFGLMQYPLFMSPYLLAMDGKNYMLTIERDNERPRFNGRFKDLSENDYLPRCMHVYMHALGSRRLERYPSAFQPGADGTYGMYVSDLLKS